MGNIDNEFGRYSIYLNNINKLINDINNCLNDCNIEFLMRLGNIFSTLELDENTKKLVDRYNEAVNDTADLLRISGKFNKLDINGDNILVQVLKKLLCNYSYDDNGLIINKRRKRTDKNFNNLKVIIKFMIDYDIECIEKYGLPNWIFSSNSLGRYHNIGLIQGQTRMHIK